MSPGSSSPIKAGWPRALKQPTFPTVRHKSHRRNPCSARPRRRASYLEASLAPTWHPRPAHRPTRAAPSPKRVLQRPVPVGAAAHPRWSPGRAVQPLQSALGELEAPPEPFPDRERSRPAGIWLAPSPPMVKGPNCESKFLSRGLVAKMHLE
jgi:hypothetical protein